MQEGGQELRHEAVAWQMCCTYYVARFVMANIENLKAFDPFADAAKGDDESVQDGLVHVRIQQRNGRKTLTSVQGLSSEYDLKKIIKVAKKEFACNGTVVDHSEYGEVLQLQGDQRENICKLLVTCGLAKQDQLKVHGF
jgi:translation initiation factor 1